MASRHSQHRVHVCLGDGAVHQVHGDHVVEEVGDPEYEIVVQDVEPVVHDVPRAPPVDQPADGAGEHREDAGGDLVADVVDPVGRDLVLGHEVPPPAAAAEEGLARQADAGEEEEAEQQLRAAGGQPGRVHRGVEHLRQLHGVTVAGVAGDCSSLTMC